MPLPLAPFAAQVAFNAAKGLGATVAGALDPQAAQRAKTKKAAQDFETMFLEQTLDRVVAGSGDGPLGENGAGGGIYRSMLVKEYAGQIAKGGGVGIANQVYREMLRLQEAGHATRS
jgi:Rod binding domain-containing protein